MKTIVRKALNTIDHTSWNTLDIAILATRTVSVFMRSFGASNILTMYGGHLGQPYLMGKIGGIQGGIAGILLNAGYEYLQYHGQIAGVGGWQDTVVGTVSGIVSILSHCRDKDKTIK